MFGRPRLTPLRGIKLAVAVLSVALVAACGFTSSQGGADAKEIVIGSICSCTGPSAGAHGLDGDILAAWVKHANEGGGINGHQVKVIQLDDAGDPTKTLQAAKKLVEQDKVMAIVSLESSTNAANAYLTSKNVPVLGGDISSAAFTTSPNFFSTGTSIWTGSLATLAIAKAAGKSHFGAIYCVEAPGCAHAVALMQKMAPVEGIGYTSYSVSMSAPDYTAQCLKAKSDDVDSILAAVTSDVLEKIAANCDGQHYQPLIVENYLSVTNSALSAPSLNRMAVWSPQANFQDESIPGVKTYIDALQKYAPAVLQDKGFGPGYTPVWAAGELFRAAAEAGKIGPKSTSADVFTGLYGLKDETLDGLTPPMTYEKGKNAATNCYFGLTADDGKWTSSNGGKPICIDPAKIADAKKVAG